MTQDGSPARLAGGDSPTAEPLAPANLYDKYTIGKRNGEPIDPRAEYFVLRLDTDPAACAAARAYADAIAGEQPAFASELRAWVRRCEDHLSGEEQ